MVLQLRVMRRWDTAQVSCTQAGIWVWSGLLLSAKYCGVFRVFTISKYYLVPGTAEC